MHTCFKSTLKHVFGLQRQSTITRTPAGIPEWLAPAVPRPLRPLRRAATTLAQTASVPLELPVPSSARTKLYTGSIAKRFASPKLKDRKLKTRRKAWTTLLEPLLPKELRRPASIPLEAEELHATPRTGDSLGPDDLPQLLREASENNADLLVYLGIVENRWDAVVWIVKHLVDNIGSVPKEVRSLSTPLTPLGLHDHLALYDVTQRPVELNHERNVANHWRTLEEMTRASRSDGTIRFRRDDGGLGQIFMSLGRIILAAADKSREECSTIMSRVLEMIAYLHHRDHIPDSVYAYPQTGSPWGLRQPPTLHLLSSRIINSLADAVFRANEAQAAASGKAVPLHISFVGQAIPGARYKIKVPELGPEVWLELLLWSCLHGGWVMEGLDILQQLQKQQRRGYGWSLICWRDVLDDPQAQAMPDTARNWVRLQRLSEYHKETPDDHRKGRQRVHKTVSAEVIIAYIDALVDTVRESEAAKGLPPVQILDWIFVLKQILDRDNMNLGWSSWDSLMLRLLDSLEIQVEKDPAFTRRLLEFLPKYGEEPNANNAVTEDHSNDQAPSYIFDGSAFGIGLLHRLLATYIDAGDLENARLTFQKLQGFTEENKMRSIQDFFRKLQSNAQQDPSQGLFHSNTPSYQGIDFPGFQAQIPTKTLAGLLSLTADRGDLAFGNFLLTSDAQDLEGSFIPRPLWSDPAIASALIKFATVDKNHALLERVFKSQDIFSSSALQEADPQVVDALCQARISARMWNGVRQALSARWTIDTIVSLGVEMIKMQFEDPDTDVTDLPPAAIIKHLYEGKLYGAPQGGSEPMEERQKYSQVLLGVLSSLGQGWADFCAPLRDGRRYHDFLLPEHAFVRIAVEVLRSRGAVEFVGFARAWMPASATNGRRNRSVTRYRKWQRGLAREVAEDRVEVDGTVYRKVERGNLGLVHAVMKKRLEELGVEGEVDIEEPKASLEEQDAGEEEDETTVLSDLDSPASDSRGSSFNLDDIDRDTKAVLSWVRDSLKVLGYSEADIQKKVRPFIEALRSVRK